MSPQRKKMKPSEPRSLLSQARELGWFQIEKRRKSRVQVQDLQETIYSDDSSDPDPFQPLPELIDSLIQTSHPLNWSTSQHSEKLSLESSQDSNDIEAIVLNKNGNFQLIFESFEKLQETVLILASKYNLKNDYTDTKCDNKSSSYLVRFSCHQGPQKCIISTEKRFENGNIEFRLNAKLNLQHPMEIKTSTKTINKITEKLVHLKNIKLADINKLQNKKLSEISYINKKEKQKMNRRKKAKDSKSIQSLKENLIEELRYFTDRLTQVEDSHENLIDMSKEFLMFLEDTDLSEE